MWRTTLALVLSSYASIAFSAVSQACFPDQVLAVYTIDTAILGDKDNQQQSKNQQLRLWRDKKQVAIEYPDTHITELWEQTHNNRLHLVRNFDNEQRGIEYQPNEIKGSQEWSLKYTLIADSLRQRMTLKKTAGDGCDQKEFYTLTENGVVYELTWLPQRQLVSAFTVIKKNSNTHWQLQSVDTSSKTVSKRFQQLQAYNTTDYIDIGDNESDPFLRKMIHLGFVEHGGSGFYDSEGNTLDSHHHH